MNFTADLQMVSEGNGEISVTCLGIVLPLLDVGGREIDRRIASNDASNKCGGISMDWLINAAVRARVIQSAH
jgi:hypothetical protein